MCWLGLTRQESARQSSTTGISISITTGLEGAVSRSKAVTSGQRSSGKGWTNLSFSTNDLEYIFQFVYAFIMKEQNLFEGGKSGNHRLAYNITATRLRTGQARLGRTSETAL